MRVNSGAEQVFSKMRFPRIQIIITIIISIALLFAVVYIEKYAFAKNERPTMQMSQSDIDSVPGIRFFLPADENRGLKCDIYSTIFEDDEFYQYFIVPKDLDTSQMVCYAIDQYGCFLNRYVINLNGADTFDLGVRSVTMVCTSLPVLSIEIDDLSPSFSELLASDKSVECFGTMDLFVDKELAHSNHWIEEIYSKDKDKNTGGSIVLRGRGNSTWDSSSKKSFTLRLEEATYLLDLGKHKSFNLISNSQDKTLLANEVFLEMSDKAGIQFEPRTQQVTLYVNGVYQGVYMLTEKVKVRGGSIDLGKNDFLINFGEPDPEQPLYYDTDMWMDDEMTTKPYANIVWPEEETEEELDEKGKIIQRFISSIENVDDDSYTEHMDLDSMVRYYWIQEISMNYDADYRSAYAYYKANTGKIYMGPVWDMDQTLGWNASKCGASFDDPTGWKVREMSWYKPLFERKEFRDAVYDVYWNGGIRELMFDAITEFENKADRLSTDGYYNNRMWRSDWPDLAPRYGDYYEDEVKGRLGFFKQRAEWIDNAMRDPEDLNNP